MTWKEHETGVIPRCGTAFLMRFNENWIDSGKGSDCDGTFIKLMKDIRRNWRLYLLLNYGGILMEPIERYWRYWEKDLVMKCKAEKQFGKNYDPFSCTLRTLFSHTRFYLSSAEKVLIPVL